MTFPEAWLEEQLADALREAAEQDAPGTEKVSYSPRYRRWERRFLSDPIVRARRQARPMWKKAAQSAACLLAACGIALAGVCAASPTARAAVKGWIRAQIGDQLNFYFDRDPDEEYTGPTRYRLSWVPEGYTHWKYTVLLGSVHDTYFDSEGHVASLSVTEGAGSSVFSLDPEGATHSTVTVNGYTADLYINESGEHSNALLWLDTEKNAIFCITAFWDEEDLLTAAKKIEINNENCENDVILFDEEMFIE